MKNFIKSIFSKGKKWDVIMLEIIEKEKNDIVFPIIMFEEGIEREFQVFSEPKEIIQESIYGHWSGVSPVCPKLKMYIVDSLGIMYKIKHNIYNRNFKVCYSYPKEEIGNLNLQALKDKIINACNESLKLMHRDDTEIKQGLNAMKNGNTIKEVIIIAVDLEI